MFFVEEKGLINLEYLSILELNGKGSFELLQGQITTDMEKVTDFDASIGAICDLKGRVVSSFYITKNSKADGYFLTGDKDVMLITNDVLKKYQPFYDTKISLNDGYKFSAISENALLKNFVDTNLNQSFQKYDGFWRMHCLEKEFHVLGISSLDKFNDLEFTDNKNSWLFDEIKNQNFEVNSETSGQFTPHELGYHLTPRVDFEKGCYTGQEIVARMHYRAKKLPQLLMKTSKSNQEPNTDVLDSDGKKIGKVLMNAKEEGENYHLLSMNKNYSNQDFEF